MNNKKENITLIRLIVVLVVVAIIFWIFFIGGCFGNERVKLHSRGMEFDRMLLGAYFTVFLDILYLLYIILFDRIYRSFDKKIGLGFFYLLV